LADNTKKKRKKHVYWIFTTFKHMIVIRYPLHIMSAMISIHFRHFDTKMYGEALLKKSISQMDTIPVHQKHITMGKFLIFSPLKLFCPSFLTFLMDKFTFVHRMSTGCPPIFRFKTHCLNFPSCIFYHSLKQVHYLSINIQAKNLINIIIL
jgi:hypothetical protein